MNTLVEIAKAINKLTTQERSGTLRIWGEWFGRAYDNMHVCASCDAQPDHVVLHFNGGEQLRVWSPGCLTVSATHLRIEQASKVRWDWHYYGRPKTAENLLFREYIYLPESITRASNEPWSISALADPKAHAVELVRT